MKACPEKSKLPGEFGAALADHPPAMAWFSTLSHPQQQKLIAHSRSIPSKAEMQRFVRELPSGKYL